MKYMILVDCNSFYCSCERVFRPELRKKPVVVLSNNDGCVISSTQEAKDVGIRMCDSFYTIKELAKKNNVSVFSSNYTLYDDMSKRVMKILNTFTNELEIYSVDEAFLEVDGVKEEDLLEFGKKIRETILKQTGLPVGVGISQTKVLAKLANKTSKACGGVRVLVRKDEIETALKATPIRDVWGIGRKSADKLTMLGIKSAWDFREYKNEAIIQKILTKTGREVQDELRGIHCLVMEEAESLDSTGTSRSFPRPVYDKEELQEAVAHFVSKATQKLRKQESVCFGISVYASSNRFQEGYAVKEKSFIFNSGTADVIKLIKVARELTEEIYEKGFGYKKAGVMLTHIVPNNENQLELFSEAIQDNENLNKLLDSINKRFGEGVIKSAACGTKQNWKTIADYKSPKYTTSWKEILKLKT